jgi:hypothetical protein
MVRVRISREYRFEGKGDRVCDLRMYLPADKEGLLIPELCDREAVVLDERLITDWGSYAGNDQRCKKRELEAPTWASLEEKVEKLIDASLETLRRVYRDNLQAIEERPADKDEIYILD